MWGSRESSYQPEPLSDPEMGEPGLPSWHGFMVRSTTLANLLERHSVQGRQRRIRALEVQAQDAQYQIERYEARIREIRSDMRYAVEQRANSQARLEALLSSPTTFDPEHAASQLDAIRHLPGVKGIRQKDGGIVIHLRTQTVYRGRLYFLGDYEIMLYVGDDRLRFSLRCTKSGKRRIRGRYESHPYWSAYACDDCYNNNRGSCGIGTGEFCFGNRATAIHDLFGSGEVAQAIQVMIDSMNRFNQEDYHRLEHFKRMRLTPRRREKLLELKAQGYDIDIDDRVPADEPVRS